MLGGLLIDIKNQVALYLTDRCTISAESSSTDEFGASTTSMNEVAADVPCRLIRGDKPTLKDLALQEKARDTYRLIVGVDTALATGQRITISGAAYEVLGLRQGMTDSVFHEALIGRLV